VTQTKELEVENTLKIEGYLEATVEDVKQTEEVVI
jgi:hypothetical protein